jgi:hypothetical protein
MQLGFNKGPTLSQGAYLTVGDYLFAMSPTQPYGFCLVLASDGDLQFWYGTTGTGLNRQYGSVLQDFSGAISQGTRLPAWPGRQLFRDHAVRWQLLRLQRHRPG